MVNDSKCLPQFGDEMQWHDSFRDYNHSHSEYNRSKSWWNYDTPNTFKKSKIFFYFGSTMFILNSNMIRYELDWSVLQSNNYYNTGNAYGPK